MFGADPRRDVALRRRTGYLPGDLRLYDRLTARELCSYFAHLRDLRGLGRAEEYAARLELPLDRPIGSLSKGNRQKVGLVQAFMHEPDLLVLDEPTAGLDPLIQQTFYTLVADVRAAGATIFVSSHVLPEVQHIADRVALIRDGQLVLVASVDELRARAFARVEATFATAPPSAPSHRSAAYEKSTATARLSCSPCKARSTRCSRRSPASACSASTATRPTSKTSFSASIAAMRAMLRNAFLKTLRDARRAIAWWSLGLVAMTALMVSVYPSVRDNPELNKMVDDYPDAFKAFFGLGENVDYTSAVGYLNSELFSFMVPLLLLIAAIGAGARATAGEEERGTLDLLLANPISRRRLVLDKLAALAAELVILALVLWLALVVGVEAIGMDVSVAHLAVATVAAALFAFVYGAIALFLGAATGRRAVATGIAAAGAVAAYLLSSLAELVESLQPLRVTSPFYHYAAGDSLRTGLAAGHTVFLLLLAAAACVAAVIAFERRDLASP